MSVKTDTLGSGVSDKGVTKKLDPNVLDEDDEFEEFPTEDWQGKEGEEDEEEDVNVAVWEDNWEDETVECDFTKQLRAELEKQGVKVQESKRS